jgi:pyrroline-5-carboxylate reductase
MNTVIAATSSAPAYVYLFIKAITDAAKIDRPDMLKFIADMVIGSAEMIKRSPMSPDELIRAVTSPNGTTERAMKIFTERDFAGIIAEAMDACTALADEIAAGMR